jgi:penicillin-binding protein 1C
MEKYVTVCSESGKLAGNLCSKTKKIYLSSISHKYVQCNNHEVLHLSKERKIIPINCNKSIEKTDTIFYLPPYMAYYYYKNNSKEKINYKWDKSCNTSSSSMDLIYPNNGLKIFLPKESSSRQNQIIAKAYHNNKNEKLYWFLDENYLGITKNQNHEILMLPIVGNHILKIIDSKGNNKSIKFEIID